MAKRIDKRIWQIFEELEREKNLQSPLLLKKKKILDDLFLVLQGTTKQVHLLLKKNNQIHTSIQFTMQHTQNKKSRIREKKASLDRCG